MIHPPGVDGVVDRDRQRGDDHGQETEDDVRNTSFILYKTRVTIIVLLWFPLKLPFTKN